MAGWNGSGQRGNSAPIQPKAKAKKPSPVHGIVAGGAVVVLAVVAYFVFFSGGEKTEAEKVAKDRGLIKEVTPAPAPKATLTNAQQLRKRFPGTKIPDDWEKPYPPQAYREDGSLKRYSRYVHVITNKLEDYHLSLEEKVFKNGADQHIALMLNHEPGGMLIGEMTYNKHFVKSFLKSLETPIVISKDDSEEVVAMKKAVIEAKADLKKRYDAGEDIAEIMNQTRKELKELGAYRQELEEQIRRIKREKGRDLTAKDYQDLIGAANTMLENRGCAPIRVPELQIRRMELRDARRAAKEHGSTGIAPAPGQDAKAAAGENVDK